jgi:sec-independent protein translocase protein TatC
VVDKEMSVIDHMEELRRRIIISAVAILVITVAALFVSDAILQILLLPSGGMQLKAFGLMDGFMIKWRIALYVGVVVAFPIWGYHLYRFISPGLMPTERRLILPALAGSTVLFIVGAVFGYYLLWGMIRVLMEFFPQQVDLLPAADAYISFVSFFLLSFGLAFQLPILLVILVQLRILSSDVLRKQRRIAYFALFVFSEMITPVADPIIAPLTVMVPLLILYEASIWIAVRLEGWRVKAP